VLVPNWEQDVISVQGEALSNILSSKDELALVVNAAAIAKANTLPPRIMSFFITFYLLINAYSNFQVFGFP